MNLNKPLKPNKLIVHVKRNTVDLTNRASWKQFLHLFVRAWKSSFIEFNLQKALNLSEVLFLLPQCFEYDTHGWFFESCTFHPILQFVFHVPETERCMREDHWNAKWSLTLQDWSHYFLYISYAVPFTFTFCKYFMTLTIFHKLTEKRELDSQQEHHDSSKKWHEEVAHHQD